MKNDNVVPGQPMNGGLPANDPPRPGDYSRVWRQKTSAKTGDRTKVAVNPGAAYRNDRATSSTDYPAKPVLK